MKTRLNIARILNLFVPGTGLIVARREWLGVTMVGIFALAANVAIFGRWIEPGVLPRPVWATALAAAFGTWLAAQWALHVQARRLLDPALLEQILTCYDVADRTLEDDGATAVDALQVALVVDDENVESYARLARASTAAGQPATALRAWRRVRELDRGGTYSVEAREAISRLKTGTGAAARP